MYMEYDLGNALGQQRFKPVHMCTLCLSVMPVKSIVAFKDCLESRSFFLHVNDNTRVFTVSCSCSGFAFKNCLHAHKPAHIINML